MTIHELLARFTPEELDFQILQHDLKNIKERKDHAEVTFCTSIFKMNPGSVLACSGPVGLIVWVPRAGFEAAHEEAKRKRKERVEQMLNETDFHDDD